MRAFLQQQKMFACCMFVLIADLTLILRECSRLCLAARWPSGAASVCVTGTRSAVWVPTLLAVRHCSGPGTMDLTCVVSCHVVD